MQFSHENFSGMRPGKHPSAAGNFAWAYFPRCESRAAEHARWALQDMEKVLEPLFFHYKEKRRAEEPFGDFCARIGFDQLRAYSAAYVPPESVSSLPQVVPHRISVMTWVVRALSAEPFSLGGAGASTAVVCSEASAAA